MTSDARAHPRSGDDAETVRVADPRNDADRLPAGDFPSAFTDADVDAADETEVDGTGAEESDGGRRSRRRRRAEARDEDDDGDRDGDDGDDNVRARGRLSVPLVPVLAVLLVLLLGATAFLWFTRPHPSSVRTADYVQVLEAARSGVVDLTSFDYLTLDDDIAQVKKVAVGDLQKESVAQLDGKRKDLTDQQAVVNTQVVGAAVTRADSSSGTVLLVIQATQQTKASTQPTVVRYRIQADLQKVSGRWRLSGITGR